MTDEWDEKKAIIQAQKDLIHFGPIFEHYFEKVFAFVFSRTNNRSIAEDLTSQIFIKILQAIPRFRYKGSFAAWVFTIARNTLNSFFRSAAYRLNENLDDRQMSEYHKQTSPHQNSKAIENTIDLEKASRGFLIKIGNFYPYGMRLRYLIKISGRSLRRNRAQSNGYPSHSLQGQGEDGKVKMTSYEHYPLNNVEQVLENQVEAHYAQYKAEPTFKQRLQSRLNDEIKEKSARPAHRPSFAQMFSSPVVKWMTGVLAFVLLVILSLGITPVRNAIGKALDLGYIDGVGFVRVSETFVLNGSIASERPSQAIVIDRVVMNSDGTRVWFHSTGETMSWSSIEGEPFAFMETDNRQYPSVPGDGMMTANVESLSSQLLHLPHHRHLNFTSNRTGSSRSR